MRRHPVIMFILMLLPVVTAAAQDSLSVSGRTRPAGFDAGDMVAAGSGIGSHIGNCRKANRQGNTKG